MGNFPSSPGTKEFAEEFRRLQADIAAAEAEPDVLRDAGSLRELKERLLDMKIDSAEEKFYHQLLALLKEEKSALAAGRPMPEVCLPPLPQVPVADWVPVDGANVCSDCTRYTAPDGAPVCSECIKSITWRNKEEPMLCNWQDFYRLHLWLPDSVTPIAGDSTGAAHPTTAGTTLSSENSNVHWPQTVAVLLGLITVQVEAAATAAHPAPPPAVDGGGGGAAAEMSSQMAGTAQALLGQLGVSLSGQQQLLGELGALMQTLRQPPAVSAEVAAAIKRAVTQQSAPLTIELEAARGGTCANGEVGQPEAAGPPSMPSMLEKLMLKVEAMEVHMEAIKQKVAQMSKMLPTPNNESDDIQHWVNVGDDMPLQSTSASPDEAGSLGQNTAGGHASHDALSAPAHSQSQALPRP